ncbi:fibroblast growth factor receptor 3-like [Mytilus trossulus]|uniref:fibroblast growth factor receptor 3-like n=1 Tax=Mytilus trossulus TaxID=6551 RepID=UPI0030041140
MGVNWSVIIVCYFLGISFYVAGSRQKDKYKSAPQVADIAFRHNLVSIEGDRLELPCKVIGSPRPFKIWYKDQRLLTSKFDNRYRFGMNALTIDPVEKNDSGIYNCHVENGLGELWINFTVKVLTEEEVEWVEYDDPDGKCQEGPPIFKDKTNGDWIARPEMSSVEIKCVACGKPKPTIKWFKDKQFIDPGVTGGRYNVREYQLKIDRLLKSDEGNYTCVVENDLGKLNFTYKLEVLMSRITKPVIVGPTNQTVQAGSDARFECKVLRNDLQHHTQWLQHYTVNGSYRDDEGQPHVKIIQQSMVNVSQPEILIIKNVTKDNAGWYTCLIANPLGRDYQTAWLTVIEGSGLIRPAPRQQTCPICYTSLDTTTKIFKSMVCGSQKIYKVQTGRRGKYSLKVFVNVRTKKKEAVKMFVKKSYNSDCTCDLLNGQKGKVLVFSERDPLDIDARTLTINGSSKIVKVSKALEKAVWRLVRKKICR